MILQPGVAAPRQSTPTTCGSACLVVARVLADPAFDRWLATGSADRAVPPALAGGDPASRFARYEAVVKARTVSARGLAGLQVPWPAALGTPPWTAVRELAAAQGVSPGDYRTRVLRWLDVAGREAALRAVGDAVRPGRAALLYVGSPTLPRHVCLVAAGGPDGQGAPGVPGASGAHGPVVYEPSRGEVTALDPAALASGAQALGGWPVVWLAVAPR